MGRKSNEKKMRRQRQEELFNIELYTIAEAAEVLRVHTATIRNWIKSGHVKFIDVSPEGSKRKAYRLKRAELERLLNKDKGVVKYG